MKSIGIIDLDEIENAVVLEEILAFYKSWRADFIMYIAHFRFSKEKPAS